MDQPNSANKALRFQEDMIRCRGIEFAHLEMTVEVAGKMGTIKGMNASANLDVLYDNHSKPRSRTVSCHPTWNIKYMDSTGQVIAQFGDGTCIFRPARHPGTETENRGINHWASGGQGNSSNVSLATPRPPSRHAR